VKETPKPLPATYSGQLTDFIFLLLSKETSERPYLEQITSNLEKYFNQFTIKKYYEDIWQKKVLKKPRQTPGTEHIRKIIENTKFWKILNGEKIPQKIAPKEVRV